MLHSDHKLIRNLIRRVRELEEELEYNREHAIRAENRRMEQCNRMQRFLDEEQERVRSREWELYEREQAVRDLDKAQQRGDCLGERRAREKLALSKQGW